MFLKEFFHQIHQKVDAFKTNKSNDGESSQKNKGKQESYSASKESDYNAAVATAAVVAVVENLRQIGDLDTSLEEILDSLPLKELFAMRRTWEQMYWNRRIADFRTCEQMYEITGHIFEQNYSDVAAFFTENQLCIGDFYQGERFRWKFAKFIKRINISRRHIQHFLDIQSKFHRLEQLELENININATLIGRMTEVLQKLKYLRINCWNETEFDGDLNEVLAHCPNITHLCLQNSSNGFTIIGNGNKWFLQKYPQLEHFELVLYHYIQPTPELKIFLELNPNIQTFSCGEQTFWANRESMLSSNIQLNELAIDVDHHRFEHFTDFCALLAKLHERGFYKRLNMVNSWQHGEIPMDELAALPSLVKLTIHCFQFVNVGLSAFTNLEELFFKASDQVTDLKAMAKKIVHLKRIHFKWAELKHISLMIKRAGNLSEIIVDHLMDEKIGPKCVRRGHRLVPLHDKSVVIKVAALNQEREKICDARKITLYVEEEIYLATKWTFKETDFSLIRLRRRV